MGSKEDPANSITMALESESAACVRGPATMTFTIKGGTGKFAQATGSGTVVFRCFGFRGTYTDTWSGTIKF